MKAKTIPNGKIFVRLNNNVTYTKVTGGSFVMARVYGDNKIHTIDNDEEAKLITGEKDEINIRS